MNWKNRLQKAYTDNNKFLPKNPEEALNRLEESKKHELAIDLQAQIF